MTERAVAPRWLAAAMVVSVALVLGAPFVGQLRTMLRTATGPAFVWTMAALVGGAVLAAVVYAAARIREQRIPRFLAVLGALVLALGYVAAASTGNPEVDAVERFHFVEYGLVTALFYRAWQAGRDAAVWIVPLLLSLLVGTFEEWLQWFIPARVGELRDVLLNLFAIVCGLLFSMALDPPAAPMRRPAPVSRRSIAVAASLLLVAVAGFIHTVHLGHEIEDVDVGVFRSRYSAAELATVGAARADAWRSRPPLTWARLSREDQYFSEAVSHVQRRNEAWAQGNVLAARHENLILERYYAPALDTPSYVSAQGLRWPDSQRADAESRKGPGLMIYVSDALPSPIWLWPKWALWLVTGALVVIALRPLGRAA
jgi:VanZ family protein